MMAPTGGRSDSARTLAGRLVAMLRRRGMRIAGAESCTGGLVAAAITAIPGSSAVFQGSLVAYANEVKTQTLGVPTDILRQRGAVSEECALAMAEGARRLFNVDLAFAVTGIAGPDGGSAEKPVGTVWGAVVTGTGEARLWHIGGTRHQVRCETVRRVLAWMLQETGVDEK